jgi:hypothetical protein
MMELIIKERTGFYKNSIRKIKIKIVFSAAPKSTGEMGAFFLFLLEGIGSLSRLAYCGGRHKQGGRKET